jgi:alcohol dehydrogenase (cytochrome c)
MAWYYQTSPHDTHDWDSAQTPILVDTMVEGQRRKLVLTASRNGFYFTVDRMTGQHVVTSKFSETANWAKGLNESGQPVRNPAKDYHVGGALVSGANQGATNWPPPAYSPDTGLFYLPASDTYAMYYLTELDPRGAMGLGGKDERSVGTVGSYLMAIDPKSGKIAWKHKYRTVAEGRGQGLLTTAGGCCSAATRTETSSRTTSLTATRSGMRRRARCRTRRKPTWWMDASMCSSRRATRCLRSR